MSAVNDAEYQSLRHLHALRNFIGNLVEQAEKSGGCECHKPPSLLLVGPPGAGKTYLVKQMSKVCEMPLFGVHTHQVANAASIKKLFLQARENYPSLVFLDDVDSIFADHDNELDRTCSPYVKEIRQEIFTELGPRKLKIHDPDTEHNPTQQQIHSSPGSSSSRASSRSSSISRRPSAPELNDSYDESLYPDNNGIIVVAATSAPWLLYKDHELLSRFRGVYLVGLPDRDSRYSLLQTLMRELHHNLTDQQIGEVADKTQGFTPADLMVVMKTLSYRQFSFLLSMTNGRGGGSQGHSTSASPTPTSSDLTETGSDTDIDGLSEPKNKARALENGGVSGTAVAAVTIAAASIAAAHANNKQQNRQDSTTTPSSSSAAHTATSSGGLNTTTTTTTTAVGGGTVPAEQRSPGRNGEGLMSRMAAAGIAVTAVGAAAATVTALNNDWTSDSEEETGQITQRARVPSGVDSVSPDSGMILSRSSEEAIPRLDQPDSAYQSNDPQHSQQSDNEHTSQHNLRAQSAEAPQSHSDNLHQHGTGSEQNETHNDKLQSNASRSSASVDDSGGDVPSLRNSNNREQPGIDHSDNIESAPQSKNVAEEHNSNDNNYNSFDTSDNNRQNYNSIPHTSSTEGAQCLNEEDHSLYDNLPNASNTSHRSCSPGADSYYENHEYERGTNIVTNDGDVVDATGCTETEEILVHPECKNAPSPSVQDSSQVHLDERTVSPPEQFAQTSDDRINADQAKTWPDGNSNDDRSVELHYSEPPDPMRNDNLAVDSDSDNESPMMRPRRVGFASRTAAIDPMSGGNSDFSGHSSAMNPLSVDCGSSDMPPNISLDDLGGSSSLNNGGTDNILRQLLSRPTHNNNNEGSPCRRSSTSPGCSPTPPASPAPSNCSSGAATLASSGSGRGSPQQHLMQQDLHQTPLHQTEDLHQQRGNSSSNNQRPRQQSPLRHRQDRQSPLHQSPHHQSSHHQSQHHHSPHHDTSHHQSPHLQSSPRVHGLTNDNRKDDERKQLRHDVHNDDSVGLKAVTGLGAAAAAAATTVTPNVANGPALPGVSEDDMAKLIDALELQLDGHGGRSVGKGSDGDGSDDTGDDDSSSEDDEEEEDDDDDNHKAGLVVDGMGGVGIQPITLADVLDVISKGYRSVSEEEIARYTEFMIWFANVAKSACPHNNGNRSEAPTLDDGDDEYGVESTLCATPSLLKRNQRRKPLRKLGKFLLKALMFILD